jgi:predicted Zn-ribbon and HTH transcriptional regulator
MDQDKKCPSCGATMIFNPGFDSLICQSCGHKEVIPELVSKVPVEEMDFLTAQNTASHDWGMEAKIVQCRQCGAETIQNKLQLSGRCPFCGSNTVDSVDPKGDVMAPMGVIPFKITETRALYIFKDWIKDRFLAPDKLEQNAQLNKFYGIYVPLFTFDTLTVNRYTGRCINDGKTWFKSGKYQFQVDDFPVVASKQLSGDKLLSSVVKDYWTREAKLYTPDALAGFPCEHYSIGLQEAWNSCGRDMEFYLKNETEKHESGGVYMNAMIATDYYNLKYKYLIVPVWINSFFYDSKLYMIVINGQTGKIDGQWPKSFGTFARKAVEFFF